MMKTPTGRFLCCAALVSLAVAFAATDQRAFGDEQPAKKAKRVYRRLPAHYADVVNQEQREKIYKLQEEYKPKIDEIQAQLNALKKELDDKISAVLTAEQRKRVEEAAGKTNARKPKPVEAVPNTVLAEPEIAK